jgi:hypothetical protein
MAKAMKIACFILAVAAIWFSLSFRGSKVFFKLGTWEHPVHVSEASSDDSGSSDSTETDFA